MKRLYIVIMSNGDQYGVPAEVIADNYAKYYESRGEDYKENFDTMIEWFDTNDYEFADWAKDNMNWSDVSDKAILVKHIQPEPDFEDGWVNGEYRYYREGRLMKYTLEITEKQAEIIKIALEEYFRLRMNQTWDFADDICFEDLKENHTEEEFNKCIENRDMFRDELEKLLNKVHPLQFRGNKFREQTIEMRRAQDIWQVVRHQLWIDRYGNKNDWCVDSRKPISMTGEALPKMERAEDEV